MTASLDCNSWSLDLSHTMSWLFLQRVWKCSMSFKRPQSQVYHPARQYSLSASSRRPQILKPELRSPNSCLTIWTQWRLYSNNKWEPITLRKDQRFRVKYYLEHLWTSLDPTTSLWTSQIRTQHLDKVGFIDIFICAEVSNLQKGKFIKGSLAVYPWSHDASPVL